MSPTHRDDHFPWDQILATAAFTPSPHNTQPWRLRITGGGRAVLFMEKSRMLPDEDTTGHFLRCAMGMYLESLRIASANAGFSLRHRLMDDASTGGLIPFAELKIIASGEPLEYPDELIRRRATSRLGSNGEPIAPAVTDRLRQFEPDSGCRYHQIDDAERIETLVGENIRAVFEDLNNRQYHDEIARWFRYSDAEASAKGDGLDYRCMRMGRAELKIMRRWPQLMRWRMTRGILWRSYRKRLGGFSHLGLISGPFFDDAASVRAGTFLMRFWLELAREGLYIHPLGNLVTNHTARERVRTLTGIADIWLVFRIGHTDPPPRSYRRPASEALLHD